MKKPLLSVCIITYNQAQYIREAIDSFLAQKVTFAWQLIIADDCSTDGTRDILLEYKKKYPDLFHLILQKHNVGPEDNWLDLIAYPKTKYLLYAEGDDYLTDPTKLQRQVDFLEAHKDFAMCFHPVKVVYQDGSQPDEVFPTPEQRVNKTVLNLDDLVGSNFIQTNSVMYRWRFIKEDVKDVFPRGVMPGDWCLHLLHAETGKIGFMNRIMAVYRRHSAGIWWEASHNVDTIWRKYGIGHLRLYTVMATLKHVGPKARASIAKKAQSVFHNLGAIDERHDEGLVRAAIVQVPAAAELFFKAESSELRHTIRQKEQLTRELEDARRITAEKDQRLILRDQELARIKSSRTWKLRNQLARLLGKQVV